MNILLIIVGAALLILGIVRLVKSSPDNASDQNVEAVDAETANNTDKRYAPAGNIFTSDSAKAKGNGFEDYVANLFKDKAVFTVKNWYQGVTSSEGVYAESNMNPDFEIEQKLSDNFNVRYWIECKYRKRFKDGLIEIEEKQLMRYKKKQGETRQKVLLAIGVGNQPTDPADFYLVPVDSALREPLTQKYLEAFQLKDPSVEFQNRMETYFRDEVFPQSRKHRN